MFFRRKNHNNEAKKVPRPVHVYLRQKFDLLPEYIDMLRCFEYDEVVSGRQVKHIRVYSPYRAKEHHLSIKTNSDLVQHPEMLLFEGHIDSQGNVSMFDRSPPSRQVKAM